MALLLVIFVPAVFVAGWAVMAWTWMITIGIMHAEWWSLMPTMGYKTALAVSLFPYIISFVTTVYARSSND